MKYIFENAKSLKEIQLYGNESDKVYLHIDDVEELQSELTRYKTAWNKLKDFVSATQDGHENIFAYSNEYIENIETEIEQLEQKLKL